MFEAKTKSEVLMALESADSLLVILQSMFNGELDRNIISEQTIDLAITGIRTILGAVSSSLETGFENV